VIKHNERVARLHNLDIEIEVAETLYSELVIKSRQFYPFRIGLRRQKNSSNVYLRWRLLRDDRCYLSFDGNAIKNIYENMSMQQKFNFIGIEKERVFAEFRYSLIAYEKTKLKDVAAKIQQANLLRQNGE